MSTPYSNFLGNLAPARRRVLPVLPDNALDFASNDCLGLSRHPHLIRTAQEWTARFGAGSGASRLVSGNRDAYQAVENRLAALKGTESALLLGSGFLANATLLPALLDPKVLGDEPVVFADKLIHASLYHGLSRFDVRRFRHNDLNHLETLLDKAPARRPRFIVTESVFSMDGDGPDLAALIALKNRYQAFLYLDEAHCTGMLGHDGMGCSTAHPGQVDLVMGTCSKGMGSYGAYIACSQTLKDYLIQTCGGIIYTTALPPAVWGAVDAALGLIPQLGSERQQVLQTAAGLREWLQGNGFRTLPGFSHIVPLLVGEDADALRFSAFLKEQGIYCPAIRPPTVPPGTARLRFSLNPALCGEPVERLKMVLKQWET